jgi:TPP-dependent pyruvate/acetoin dehydrogenase alpha subunit
MPVKSKESTVMAGAPPSQNGFSLISNQKLLQLYSTMLKCRLLEERIRILARKNSAAWAVSVGHEASAVGVLLDLLPADAIAPAPRDVIPAFIRGVPLDSIFASLDAPGQLGYAPLHVIPPASGIATRMAVATGVALSHKLGSANKITIAFAGKESPSPGLWHEALQFAGVHALPIVYVCLNKKESDDIASRATHYGVPGIAVDGNDVVAVYRVAHESIVRARQGRGPTLIDCRTSRAYGDPILNMEKYLSRKGLFTEEFKVEVSAAFSRELDAAIKINWKAVSSKKA